MRKRPPAEIDPAPLRRPLLRWFDERKRDLPWRRNRDPWRIWLSEIMLQQTTAAAVIPHFERFVRRFPSLSDLARAREEEVLELWSGLGYYQRARNLHRAAQQVEASPEGLPRTAAGLRALPGFGAYTAAAVASIAFGEATPVVDGNVVRVVARVARLGGHAKDRRLEEEVRRLASVWIDPRRPGDWNEATMELGAMLCRPQSPRCTDCPVAPACRSRAAGDAEGRPAVPPRREGVDVRLAAGLFARGDELFVRRREGTGFLDGMPELPSLPCSEGEEAAAIARLFRSLGFLVRRVEPTGATIRQAVTFRRVTVSVWRVEGTRPLRLGEETGGRFVPLDPLPPLPALFRKALEAGLAAGQAGGGATRRSRGRTEKK
jgi:A/G-specific adenine glycosylase